MAETNDLSVLHALAKDALSLWDMPEDAAARLINLSENATYRVEDPAAGKRWALRVHREGYHSKTAIASELAWLTALREGSSACQGDIPFSSAKGSACI